MKPGQASQRFIRVGTLVDISWGTVRDGGNGVEGSHRERDIEYDEIKNDEESL